MDPNTEKDESRAPKAHAREWKQAPGAVLVLGMHRAGTSVIGSGLNALGVSLGDDLLGADENNPKGYWEDRRGVALNEKALSLLGLDWHSLKSIRPAEWERPEMADLRAEAVDLIKNHFGRYPLWGFKDPRLCRLLDLWQPAFDQSGTAEAYVISIRNPLSVARSLRSRNGFSAEKSYLLWLQHFLPALNRTHGKPRVVVDYDEFLAHPLQQLERIADRLNLVIDGPTRKTLVRFCEDFLDRELRHAKFGLDDLKADPSAPLLLRETYDHLGGLAHDAIPGDQSDIQRQWEAFSERFESLDSILPYIDVFEGKLGLPERLLAQLYIDSGNGFTEEESLLASISKDTLELSFKFGSTAPKALFFDPSNTFSVLNLDGITLTGPDTSYDVTEYDTNGMEHNHQLFFATEDPRISIDVPEGLAVTGCRIKLGYSFFGYDAVLHILDSLSKSLSMQQRRDVAERIGAREKKLAKFQRSCAHKVCLRRAWQKFSYREPGKALSFYKNARTIIRSDIFDYRFYAAISPDLAEVDVHPLVHFLEFGASEGRNPHPLFDTKHYTENNPESALSGINPLVHYLGSGTSRKSDPHPLFDTSFYLENNPEAVQTGENPLLHFLRHGAHECRSPHPLFDTAFFQKKYPDVVRSGENPLCHFIVHGAVKRRNPHPLFDTSYYLKNNPDVDESGVNPLVHFVLSGAAEGRNPSPLFDIASYLAKHPDIIGSGINPLIHFILHGATGAGERYPKSVA